ncbi:MAG TPA: tetratricopeptide repeat protein [Nitrospirota bacterium]|nr:tetratricopeptide repeat protein [Nitrospirota bacterium]
MTGKRIQYYLAAIVALTTLAVYTPVLRNDFVLWDDDRVVIENINIRSLDRSFLMWAFTDVAGADYWHPVTWISHAVDYALWGLDPLGHHLTSILLHALNTFIVIILIVVLFEAVRKNGTVPDQPIFPDERWILMSAGITGVLFGLHPVHVESVAWISERKDLLYSLFSLLSVMAYLRHVKGGDTSVAKTGRNTVPMRRWYYISVTLFLLALASKPMAVTLPVVLMILDWYPLGRIQSLRSFGNSLKEKTPFIALSLVITTITMIAQKAASLLPALDAVPVTSRILVGCWALIRYIWKMIVPLDLLPLYPYPKSVAFWSTEYLLPVILVVGVTAACVIVAKRRKVFLASWLYYVISLLPVLGLLQVGHHSMADRFTYLPSMAPFLLAGVGAARAWERLRSFSRNERAAKAVAVVCTVILFIGLSWLTVRQTAIWKDSITLWSHVLEKETAGVPLAYNNRGIAYAKIGKSEQALRDFASALSLDPVSPFSYNNRGKVYLDMGQPDRALADFNRAIEQDPSYQNAYLNRGAAFRTKGQPDRAIEDYVKALFLKPDSAETYVSRGIVYGETGRHEQAIEDFTAAINTNPSYADAYTARGLSFEQSGQLERAIEDLNTAISLDPKSVDAYLNRGVAYERMGRHERAIEDYDKAITLSPSDFLLYCNRGIAFREMGRIGEAIKDYTKALSLKPDFAQGYVDRGHLYEKAGQPDLAHRDYQKACYLGSKPGCHAMRDGRRSGEHP